MSASRLLINLLAIAACVFVPSLARRVPPSSIAHGRRLVRVPNARASPLRSNRGNIRYRHAVAWMPIKIPGRKSKESIEEEPAETPEDNQQDESEKLSAVKGPIEHLQKLPQHLQNLTSKMEGWAQQAAHEARQKLNWIQSQQASNWGHSVEHWIQEVPAWTTHSVQRAQQMWNGFSTSNGTQRLAPFQRGQPSSASNQTVQDILERGEVWQNTHFKDNAVFGQAAMDIEAPPPVVWHQLLDFASYPGKVPSVESCKVYKRKVEGASKERIFVQFVSSILPGITSTNHVEHVFEPAKDSVAWTLDSTQKNGFKQLQGHWHVAPHPKNPLKSRVFYEIGIVAPVWLPKWLVNKFAVKTVSDATTWIVKESELDIIPQEGSALLPQPGASSQTTLPEEFIPEQSRGPPHNNSSGSTTSISNSSSSASI